jgi:hypothetical protein
MRSNLPSAGEARLSSRHQLLLILAAAVLHVSVTAAVFITGRAGVNPGQFDQKGLGTFASDGLLYQTEVLELCGVLKKYGVISWLNWPAQLHVRLYSLPVAALSRVSSFNILTIEPLNLIYYLAIIFLVFKLGDIIFNYRTGLMAAATVALWPSLLLHTTQLLRDPLLIVSFLTLMLSLTLCLKRNYQWLKGIFIGLAAVAAMVLISIVRLPMWNVVWIISVLTTILIIVRLVRQKRFQAGNALFVIILIAGVTFTPRFQNSFRNQQFVKSQRIILPEELQKLTLDEQIALRRRAFELKLNSSGEAVPSEGGSDIDKDIHLNSVTDIIHYLPRAMVVGFLAPFPNQWFISGKAVGAGGRLLSGFETLLVYVIECLALFAVWRERRNISAWFLFLVITIGAVALGLVVANMGALYRLRYPFWILLIVLGAGGADSLWRSRSKVVVADRALERQPSSGTNQS